MQPKRGETSWNTAEKAQVSDLCRLKLLEGYKKRENIFCADKFLKCLTTTTLLDLTTLLMLLATSLTSMEMGMVDTMGDTQTLTPTLDLTMDETEVTTVKS